ncbi:hypothetical protein K491DRAFT_49939 [Lophiostoma macrostomum CBS 122681]|uniref:Uncharacterized protein n=1 Tax=Lophiostoma macrostomum CBS 122681 TaxID=1314788 RepID=A0A6A6T0R4_9PLEO|nr:hypothetical protein K491DRAFT_49939 [Lophiostoma macrostomum CBS 122681]
MSVHGFLYGSVFDSGTQGYVDHDPFSELMREPSRSSSDSRISTTPAISCVLAVRRLHSRPQILGRDIFYDSSCVHCWSIAERSSEPTKTSCHLIRWPNANSRLLKLFSDALAPDNSCTLQRLSRYTGTSAGVPANQIPSGGGPVILRVTIQVSPRLASVMAFTAVSYSLYLSYQLGHLRGT